MWYESQPDNFTYKPVRSDLPHTHMRRHLVINITVPVVPLRVTPHVDPDERALVCSACGYTVYPRIAPAVIVLVTKGDKVLLQRTPGGGHGNPLQ